MTYEELKDLHSVLSTNAKELEIQQNNLFKNLTDDAIVNSMRRGRTKLNFLEEQIAEERDGSAEENRFLYDYSGREEEWKQAMGSVYIKLPSKADFIKMSATDQNALEQQILKNIVISYAQQASVANRFKKNDTKAMERKNDSMVGYIAYATMYNAKYPGDEMSFGFCGPDSISRIGSLVGNVPGFSSFGLHFRNDLEFAKMLKKVNGIMRDVSSKIGLNFYNIRYDIRNLTQARNDYYNAQKKIQAGKPNKRLTEEDYTLLSKHYLPNVTIAVGDFINNHPYQLERYSDRSGVVNCYNYNNIKKYADIVSKAKNKMELDAIFNVIFENEPDDRRNDKRGFNLRERMYIAERAGLPLPRLKEVEEINVASMKTGKPLDAQRKMRIESFIRRNAGQSEEEKLDAIKKITDVCKYIQDDFEYLEKVMTFVRCLDANDLGIDENKLKQFKSEIVADVIYQFDSEERDGQNLEKYSVTNYALGGERTKEILRNLGNDSKAIEVYLGRFGLGDILDFIEELEEGEITNKDAFSKAMSSLVKKLDAPESDEPEAIREALELDGLSKERFLLLSSYLTSDARKILIKNAVEILKDEGKEPEEIRKYFGMLEQENIKSQPLNLYEEIRAILPETTRETRKKAEDVENAIETSKKSGIGGNKLGDSAPGDCEPEN